MNSRSTGDRFTLDQHVFKWRHILQQQKHKNVTLTCLTEHAVSFLMWRSDSGSEDTLTLVLLFLKTSPPNRKWFFLSTAAKCCWNTLVWHFVFICECKCRTALHSTQSVSGHRNLTDVIFKPVRRSSPSWHTHKHHVCGFVILTLTKEKVSQSHETNSASEKLLFKHQQWISEKHHHTNSHINASSACEPLYFSAFTSCHVSDRLSHFLQKQAQKFNYSVKISK